MASTGRNINNEIIYNNYKFEFINKFEYSERVFVNLISTNLSDGSSIELTFVRSNSECGMWRICIANYNGEFYLEKGNNYTMSSFIILEIQIFLNSILNNLEEIEWGVRNFANMKNCFNMFENLDITINNKDREIEEKMEDFEKFDETNLTDIQFISDYEYNAEYENYHPLFSKDREKFEMLSREEDQKKSWPEYSPIYTKPNENTPGSVNSINHGKTVIRINGKIYSAIYDNRIKIYYMIYDCDIKTPETIHLYEQTSDDTSLSVKQKDYQFFDTHVENFIIPIYFIPMSIRKSLEIDLTYYGLYNYYSSIKIRFNTFNYHKKPRKLLSFEEPLFIAKILGYIHNKPLVRDLDNNVVRVDYDEIMPSCTTFYRFLGFLFEKINFLKKIKEKTISSIQQIPAELEYNARSAKKIKKKSNSSIQQISAELEDDDRSVKKIKQSRLEKATQFIQKELAKLVKIREGIESYKIQHQIEKSKGGKKYKFKTRKYKHKHKRKTKKNIIY